MELKEFIEQTLGQCKEAMYEILEGLTPEELVWRPGSEANHIGFGYAIEQVTNFPELDIKDVKEYLDSVRPETLDYLRNIAPAGFEVYPGADNFPNWDIGYMFSYAISKEDQHLGHIVYLRGLQRGIIK